MKITIERVKEPEYNKHDLENVPFGKYFTDHMFVADYDGEKWINPQIKPVENISMHPGNMTLHYGQSIFEGMKATRHSDGTPLLFRPIDHFKRFNKSAERMCMPHVSEELFMEGLKLLVSLDRNWIPKSAEGALYLRPFMYAADEYIGVGVSKTYKFCILTLPVGPYYSSAVSLKADSEYVRAAPGGVGEAKTSGNYAASLYPAVLAKKEGYDQVMWLDSKEFRYIQEVGTMNIFFVIDGKVITPNFNGAVLHGITRASIIELLLDNGYTVEERPITIDEVYAANAAGKLQEVFGSGTAAVVSVVDRIGYKGKDILIDAENYKIAPFIKSFISGVRIGKVEDKYGWTYPIQKLEFA